MKIVFTDSAKEDARLIYKFNSQINVLFAKYIQKRIFEEIKVLKNFPRAGKKETFLKRMNIQFRSLVVAEGRYKVIYFAAENCITVHVIFDCRRNPKIIE